MGVQAGQYSIFTMLRKRVLDVAVQEINEKTDLQVGYVLEKEGRKTQAISVFTMHVHEVPFQEEETHNAIMEKLQGFGIKKKKAGELLANHDEQYLWANIAIVEEQVKKGKVSNMTAYLLKAFQDDYRPIETELDKQKQVEEAAKQQRKAEAKKAEEYQARLKNQFEQEKEQLLQELLAQFPEEKTQQLQSEFIA